MATRLEEELARRGHGPGEHLFEFRRSERRNVDLIRICVGYTADGGCDKEEQVNRTCMVCDEEGVVVGGITIPFEVTDGVRGRREMGPLCPLCLKDFAAATTIRGFYISECEHEWSAQGRCLWCGENRDASTGK